MSWNTRWRKPTAVPSGTGCYAVKSTADGPGVDPERLRVPPAGTDRIPGGRLDPALEDFGVLVEGIVFNLYSTKSC